jgi:hypothetical protein
MLLTVAPLGDDSTAWHGQIGLCSCPYCSGIGLDQIPQAEVAESGALAESNPLSSLPQLSSNPGATAKLFLDFNGHFQASWGAWSNITTPVFDQDGDPTTFSNSELSTIQQIWARVAEDYAPFNIDVTTIAPGTTTKVAHIAIGGSSYDWYGSGAGGVAYVGGFYNSAPHVGYVFPANLGNGNPKYVAEAASHEAGHLFGLQHQATWDGTTLVTAYNRGASGWAPIMGVGYYEVRTTWHNGPTSSSSTSYQDDMAILANSLNGFGYRPDDYGSTVATASPLPISGNSVNLSGLIGRADDRDVFSFTTGGGTLSFQLNVAQYGPNLDSVLELWDSSGSVLVVNAPTNSLNSSISTTVGAGTYYLVARGMGDYGNVGQYTLTGTLPDSTAAPAIGITLGGNQLTDGQTVSFGNTPLGTPVTHTFTVSNHGTSTLALNSINAASLPAGFSLAANVGSTSLAPGQSTTFAIRLDATTFGSYSGPFQLFSNDADENPFDLTLTGTVLAPEITVRIGTTNVTDGQTVNFGDVVVGNTVSRTFTVLNEGNSTLTLTPLNAGSMPAGFTLVSNIGATSLAPGQSTTFAIRFDAPSAGSFGGPVALANNDPDENPFDLNLAGSAYVEAPEITVLVGGQEVVSGGTVDFGATVVGSPTERTIHVRNDGNATLTLTAISSGSLPAGFSLVSNLGSTSLAPGQSTSFVVRLDAAIAGSFSGTLNLSNNDSDENPYSLNLTGSVAEPAPSVKRILDDGSTGHSLVGTWKYVTGRGYDNDLLVAKKGNGSIHSTWAFNSLPNGEYQVWATWGKAPNNASNAPFTVSDGSTAQFTRRIDQRQGPSGLWADGGNWTLLGTVTITSGRLVVRLTNAANNQVVADAIRIESVTQVTASAPEIGVAVGGFVMTSGKNKVTYGPRDVGQPQTFNYTVTNAGNASLSLAQINNSHVPAGFSVAQPLSSTYLAPGETATFRITLDATAVGSFGGTVTIRSSDGSATPFTFNVNGSVVDPSAPVLRISDAGGGGNKLVGTWQTVTGRGYNNNIHTAAKGNGSIHSTWTFGNLPDGQYNVWATWRIASTYATNAPFTLHNGSQQAGSVQLNQRLTPSGLWDGSTNWQHLGVVTVTSGQLSVKLTNNANGTVVADAVRIERITAAGAAVLASTMQVSLPNQLTESSAALWIQAALASSARPAELHRGPAVNGGSNDSSLERSFDPAPAGNWDLTLAELEPENALLADALELVSRTRSALGEEESWLAAAADELAAELAVNRLL